MEKKRTVEYFYARAEEFTDFVEGRQGFSTVKDLAIHLSENKIELPENGFVVFQKTSKLRKPKPRPVAAGIIVESTRKLGPRTKKQEAEATQD